MDNNDFLTLFYDQYLYISVGDKVKSDEVLFLLEDIMDRENFFAPITTGDVDRFLESKEVGGYFLEGVKYYSDLQITPP